MECTYSGACKAGSFARSRHGCDACVTRVAMDEHPGLVRSRDSEAQWLHGGPEYVLSTRPPNLRARR
jgi:hypothetical protein